VAAVCDFSAIVQTRRTSAGNSVSVRSACARARERARERASDRSIVVMGFSPRELSIRRHFVRARPRQPPYCKIHVSFSGFPGMFIGTSGTTRRYTRESLALFSHVVLYHARRWRAPALYMRSRYIRSEKIICQQFVLGAAYTRVVAPFGTDWRNAFSRAR